MGKCWKPHAGFRRPAEVGQGMGIRLVECVQGVKGIPLRRKTVLIRPTYAKKIHLIRFSQTGIASEIDVSIDVSFAEDGVIFVLFPLASDDRLWDVRRGFRQQ